MVEAERRVRELAEWFEASHGDDPAPEVALENGIQWMYVGRNSTHEFQLGWDSAGKLFQRAYGPTNEDVEHYGGKYCPHQCVCDPPYAWSPAREVQEPGYIGHS